MPVHLLVMWYMGLALAVLFDILHCCLAIQLGTLLNMECLQTL